MKRFKKILAVMLSVMMVVGMIPAMGVGAVTIENAPSCIPGRDAHGALNFTSVKTPATCTAEGKTEWGAACEYCGYMPTATVKTSPALGHEYEEEVISSTCAVPGKKIITCVRTGCDYYYEEELPLSEEHSGQVTVVPSEPTCTEPGKTVISGICDICGEEFWHSETETAPAKGHSGQVTVVTSEATCTEPGKRVASGICDICGVEFVHVETETAPAKGHSGQVTVVPTEATCTEPGKTVISGICDICGEEFWHSETETAPALGHAYKDGKCAICGEKDPNASTAPVIPVAPVVPFIPRLECFETTEGQFDEIAYFCRSARVDDVVILKVSTSDLGDIYGLDYKNLTVKYEVEGAVQVTENYDYNSNPVYKDGIATQFKLVAGSNVIKAKVYYNGNYVGEFAPFYVTVL